MYLLRTLPILVHSHGTSKLWQLSTGKIIIRRNVAFNERIYPGRKMNVNPGTTSKHDDGADLVGLDFLDEGTRYTVSHWYIRQ
jgi:hypothetical protein